MPVDAEPSVLCLKIPSSTGEAFFSPDGAALFFAPFDKGMDVRIWMVDLSPEGWQNPRPLGEPVSQDPAFYPVMDSGGRLY